VEKFLIGFETARGCPNGDYGKRPFGAGPFSRLGRFLWETADLAGREFTFALPLLDSMRLAAREVLTPIPENAVLRISYKKYRPKRQRRQTTGGDLPPERMS